MMVELGHFIPLICHLNVTNESMYVNSSNKLITENEGLTIKKVDNV